MKKSPTVVDVAKLAGVGASTVSRYLRGVKISKSTAALVEQAIRKIGYYPDGAARALRVGRTQSIGVIVPKVSNAFFGCALQLMEERAREAGYTLMLFTHLDRSDEQAKQLSMLRRCRVDGVLLTAAPGTSHEQVQEALGQTPIVAFDACISTKLDTVVLQNRQAGKDATAHLAAHGYKRIAVVGAKPKVFSFAERIAGYSDFMNSPSLSPSLLLAEDYDQLRQILRSALNGRERPEALLSLSDFATHNIIRVFEELHLKPENWVPLVGFDDFSYAPLLGVPITVIRQPIEEMVRTSLNILIRHIEECESEHRPELIEIPGELIRRRSCGCA